MIRVFPFFRELQISNFPTSSIFKIVHPPAVSVCFTNPLTPKLIETQRNKSTHTLSENCNRQQVSQTCTLVGEGASKGRRKSCKVGLLPRCRCQSDSCI